MNVFTYGSLMFAPVWRAVVRGEYESVDATVHGFERLCVRGAAHPALIIAPRALPMQGRLYLNVVADDLARLDHFETENYARVTIAANVDGSAVVAQTYVALHLDALSENHWDVAQFEAQGLPLFLKTYVAMHRPLN